MSGPSYKWWCMARLTWSRPAAVFWNMDNSQHNTKLLRDGVGLWIFSKTRPRCPACCRNVRVVGEAISLGNMSPILTRRWSPVSGHTNIIWILGYRACHQPAPARQQCRAGATNLSIINILARPAAFMKHILADKHPLTLFYYFWYFYCNFCKLQHGTILIGFSYISETQKLGI